MANKKNGTLYLGVTNDLLRRVRQHKNDVNEGFTKKYGIHRLVWYGATTNIKGAIRREKQMKKWRRKWKIDLIEKRNPNWDDLCESLVAAWIPAYAGMTDFVWAGGGFLPHAYVGAGISRE